MSVRRELALFGALTVLVAILALVVPTYPNYDTYFHLDWAREVLRGHAPHFQAYAASTEHPLWLLLSILSVLAADGSADRVLVVFCVLSLVALAWGTFRLGRTVFGTGPGLAAAAFTLTAVGFVLFAVRGYLDLPYLALIAWAGALEASRPRRGVSVMVLLVFAGLLRPEAWLLGGFYWLWCGPGDRVWRHPSDPDLHEGTFMKRGARRDLLALVLIAPVLWCGLDAAVTGDPLFSLHSTSKLADALGRTTGLGNVPGTARTALSGLVQLPVIVLAILGLILAWRRKARIRSFHVLWALLLTGALTYLAVGVAGLSLLPRYLTMPALALCLLAGYALLGWTTLAPDDRLRERWRRGCFIAVALGLVFVAVKHSGVTKVHDELRFLKSSHQQLVGALEDPATAVGRRCGPISFPTYRGVPDARFILDASEGRVIARSHRHVRRGVAIVVTGAKGRERFGYAAGVPHRTNTAPAGFRTVATHGIFVVTRRCPSR